MATRYDKRTVCKYCGSGNITFKTICTGRDHKKAGLVYTSSWWYECGDCKYSSSGRSTLQEAEADAKIVPIEN